MVSLCCLTCDSTDGRLCYKTALVLGCQAQGFVTQYWGLVEQCCQHQIWAMYESGVSGLQDLEHLFVNVQSTEANITSRTLLSVCSYRTDVTWCKLSVSCEAFAISHNWCHSCDKYKTS